MRITLFALILIACGFLAIGQAPIIQTVAPINAGTPKQGHHFRFRLQQHGFATGGDVR